VDGSQLMSVYCVGGAALAFWMLLRFPRFGPRTLVGSGAALLAALVLAAVGPFCVDALISVGGQAGALAALLGLVLPTLTAIFWTASCLFRVAAGLLTGTR
jgi:hypothetical protein